MSEDLVKIGQIWRLKYEFFGSNIRNQRLKDLYLIEAFRNTKWNLIPIKKAPRIKLTEEEIQKYFKFQEVAEQQNWVGFTFMNQRYLQIGERSLQHIYWGTFLYYD